MSADLPRAEHAIAALHQRGDMDAVASALLHSYGPEILRFLATRTSTSVEADELFSDFCQDMWLALPGFRWGSSARTWLYVLARHAAVRGFKRRAVERKRHEPASDSAFMRVAEQLRMTTPLHQRSEVKSRMRELRETLREDQQTLLLLRIDRDLSWKELAVVMGEVEADASGELLDKAAARVRTRFQAAKRALLELARREGIGAQPQ